MWSESLAITLSSVWAAVTLIAGHMASVPLNLYRRAPNGGKTKATDHPLWRALHDEPYPGISSYEFREALNANIELHGVGYVAAIVSQGRLSLMPFNSMHVTPDHSRRVYRISNGKRPQFDVPAEIMIVFPSLTLDGINPVQVTKYRQRSISLAISYEDRAEAYNRNGSVPAGIAIWGEGYGKMNDDDKKRLEAKWDELYRGVSNSGGTAFLPQGSTFTAVQFDPEKLQMLASREFSVQEIARWFRVPPHKIGDLSRATFSNIEHQAIEYVQDCLLPRANKMEAILSLALIPEDQRGDLLIEHNLDGLQRGDFKTRMEGYAIGRNGGWVKPNNIMALENMDPISEEDGGETYLVPLNMIPANINTGIAKDKTEDGSTDAAPVVEGADKIQDTALNGAQVQALVGIFAEIAAGKMTKSTAKQLILVAFPLIAESAVDGMLKDVEEGSAPEDAVRSWLPDYLVRGGGETIRRTMTYLRCRAAATVRRGITAAYAPAFKRSASAVLKTEIDEVRKAASTHLPGDLPAFLAFLDEFYADNGFLPEVRQGVQAVITDYAGQIETAALEEIGVEPTDGAMDDSIAHYIDNYAVRHVATSRGQLAKSAREADADADEDALVAVTERLDGWEESRADEFARDDGIRAEGSFSRAAWLLAGVLKFMWVTFDKSCPSCSQLDGKIVGVAESFVTSGGTVGSGTPAAITVNTNIRHPQLHKGCDCGIAAVIG